MKYYNVIIFCNGRPPVKFRKVTSLDKLQIYLRGRFNWVYMNVYDAKKPKGQNYLRRIYAESST